MKLNEPQLHATKPPVLPHFVVKLLGEPGVRIYANYKRTYEGKGCRWMLMYLFSRFYWVRQLIKAFTKSPAQANSSLGRFRDRAESVHAKTAESLFGDLDVEEVMQTLHRAGCYIGLRLPPQIVQEIRAFAESGEAIANFDRHLRFTPAQREEYEAKYGKAFGVGSLLHLHNCEAVQRIQRDPKLREIARRYLETEPVIATRLWWSFPASISRFLRFQLSQEVFHYDTIDYNALKFFFYLTPVDHLNGPHMCVLKSHRCKKLSYLFTVFIGRYEEQILEDYRAEDVVTIYGDAGYGFVEDPFCFHRATPVLKKPRLMLEVSCTQRKFRLNDFVTPM